VPVLRTLPVAPITRSVRGIPTEVSSGPTTACRRSAPVTLGNVTVADEACFTRLETRLSAERMAGCAAPCESPPNADGSSAVDALARTPGDSRRRNLAHRRA
jgi:hypothetical protein